MTPGHRDAVSMGQPGLSESMLVKEENLQVSIEVSIQFWWQFRALNEPSGLAALSVLSCKQGLCSFGRPGSRR